MHDPSPKIIPESHLHLEANIFNGEGLQRPIQCKQTFIIANLCYFGMHGLRSSTLKHHTTETHQFCPAPRAVQIFHCICPENEAGSVLATHDTRDRFEWWKTELQLLQERLTNSLLYKCTRTVKGYNSQNALRPNDVKCSWDYTFHPSTNSENISSVGCFIPHKILA